MSAIRKRRKGVSKASAVKPVKVNAAIQKQYRDRLQAANQQYKRIVDKKVNTLIRRINALDKSKPGVYHRQAAIIFKAIDGLDRNLAAANKRSEKAVNQFIAAMDKENLRRTKNSFGKKIDLKLQEFQMEQKDKAIKKRTAKLEKEYVKSIQGANSDYSDRVQKALYEKLGNPNINARKKITKARGIVTRRIKNTVTNQSHELNATLSRIRQKALGVKEYRWQTMQDEKVRNTHREHNQRIYQYGEIPVTPSGTITGIPGEDHGCRCWAIPLLKQG